LVSGCDILQKWSAIWQNGGNDWGNIGSVHWGLINMNVHRSAW
jgi:hypothetical protein